MLAGSDVLRLTSESSVAGKGVVPRSTAHVRQKYTELGQNALSGERATHPRRCGCSAAASRSVTGIWRLA